MATVTVPLSLWNKIVVLNRAYLKQADVDKAVMDLCLAVRKLEE